MLSGGCTGGGKEQAPQGHLEAPGVVGKVCSLADPRLRQLEGCAVLDTWATGLESSCTLLKGASLLTGMQGPHTGLVEV